MGREGDDYDCELMARSSILLVKEDLSSRPELIDLLGCGGLFQTALAAKFMAALGAPPAGWR